MTSPHQTAPEPADRRDGRAIMFVHAHPDDETINNGATMAKYAAEGVHVTLVTCTLGEEGEVLVPELADLASDQDDRLGPHRAGELADAMKELGVVDHRFLGGPGHYRDSGMMGTPQNDRADAFWQADLDEAAGMLAAVIREVRPQVLVTYNEFGGYGHPDHIQAHRVAMRAVELAVQGAQPHQVSKVYWNTMPRSVMKRAIEAMRAAGNTSGFLVVDSVDDLPFVADDSTVTAVIHAEAFAARKSAAMRAHATQITVDGPFFALSNSVGREVMAVEYYQLVHGSPGAELPESDLFAGLGL
ncbi:MAG TPA: N-acetyl-1-D-myo-inositol-2-amino-2-deoxy-alpha-D-glucopyranoside deacetylase [Actinocrinis sp.]|jgi:N-acetyl-1-D-myo-inositol-2-amino-2-deoxy-alpha-D-glucopyranoside deacetylase|uniref:N-acetyl-1-D-myo-inositol-2-amino-2-deoxy-alpha- D-glucopyranoside deacetylase n=1 Tax=Actinocrinis sp. TaxID=1920516 RepID=UPI002DDDB91E|nr:N-acetyl-1-D-myo-inositol-2-amino-2-deoxy-alpha-D-glucopyranoside deacetylase [Actinocrinis sp.]HEV3171135.1 N-acetyl-1-D-myo-inositol-2-amino-2-deoxy-alpha-D-glucopyranoside deacetylase [Actinocrinis sp.]